MDLEKRKGYAGLFMNLMLRSTIPSLFKYSGLPTFHFLVGRYLVSLPFLCWMTAKRGDSFWPKRKHLWPIVVTSLTLSLGAICVFKGFLLTGSIASLVVVIKFSSLVGFLLGPRLVGDPENSHALIAFLLATLGLSLVIWEMPSGSQALPWAVLGGILLSGWDNATRWVNNSGASAEQTVLWQTIICLGVTIIVLGSNASAVKWIWQNFWPVLLAGLVSQTAFLIIFEAQRRIKNVQHVMLLCFFEPVIVAIYDRVFRGTFYGFGFWTGISLLIIGIGLIVRSSPNNSS